MESDLKGGVMEGTKNKKAFLGGLLLTLASIPFLISPSSALETETRWKGLPGANWNVPANWDPSGVPDIDYDVVIAQPGDAVSYINPGNNPTLNSLRMGLDSPADTEEISLTQNQDFLTVKNSEIGSNGTANYFQNGGAHKILQDLKMGSSPTAQGNYFMNGGSLSVGGHEMLGLKGEGFIDQFGGNTVSSEIFPSLGCTPPVPPSPPVGPTHTVSKNLYLGIGKYRIQEGDQEIEKYSFGGINLTNSSLIVNGSAKVGIQGEALFDQAGGLVKIKANYYEDPSFSEDPLLRSPAYSITHKKNAMKNSLQCVSSKGPGLIVGLQYIGNYRLHNGTLDVDSSEIIGQDDGGKGEFLQNNGTHTVDGNFYLGQNPGSSGSFSLSTTTSPDTPTPPKVGLLDVQGFASVGYLGKGDFTQEGGTVMIRGIDQEVNLRGRSLSTSLSRSRSLSCTQQQYVGFTVGRGGTGSYTLNDGELIVSRGEVIGLETGSDGYFQQNSGNHYVGGALTIARDSLGKGVYDFFDGTLVVRNGLVNNGTFNHIGGVLQAQVTNNKEYNFSGGTIQGRVANNRQFNVEEQGGQKVLGDFFNQAKATVTANHTNAQFNKNFYNSGKLEILGGSSLNIKNLTVNPTGYLSKTGDPTTLSIKGNTISNPVDPDTLTITGNLINNRTIPGDWHTELVDLVFSGVGTHYFKTGSNNTGIWNNNFAWKSMTIVGNENTKLRLQGHLYAEKIEGVLSNAGTITNLTGFCGIGIYYDKDLSQDLAGLKLYNPWGRLVGTFSANGFVSTCK
jgi:hypothetical protein